MGKVLALVLLLAACRPVDSGLAPVEAGILDMAAPDTRPIDARPTGPDPVDSARYEETSTAGCADQTREGFLDATLYPAIAACAGAFLQGGVVAEKVDAGGPTSCTRSAGNTPDRDGKIVTSGVNCRAEDLCARGWHLCLGPVEVAKNTPNNEGCAGYTAHPETDDRFFLVATGASPQGICTSDRTATNDLHGCGGLGRPEDASCAPLNRRMSFADCALTSSWVCGTEDSIAVEARVVSKLNKEHGGVLCCRDPQSVDAGPGLRL